MKTLELIRQIRAGNQGADGVQAAKEKLYSIARQALLASIDNRIPARLRSRFDAEDILDEAFVKVLERLKEFAPRSEASFLAWVYTVARNHITTVGRRRSSHLKRFARGPDEKGPRESGLATRRRSPESQLQRRDWIESMLGHLSPREAQVVRLHDLEQQSYDEIAAAWQKTPGAVQRLHSRAQDHLREVARRQGRS